ncbi:hypothetical protein MD484_g3709, partial [Candolleomyces efflorescens]
MSAGGQHPEMITSLGETVSKPQVPQKPVECVLVVVDGNSAVFSDDYVLDADGSGCGGMRASTKIQDIVKKFIGEVPGIHIQYRVHVRLDRRKVAEAMSVEWDIERGRMRRKLDAFIVGFNGMHHETHMMDSEINDCERGYLQFDHLIRDELRLSRTRHIVFVAQISELAALEKKKPCVELVQGRPCQNAQRCIWAHQCPFDGQCRFLKNKCWFCDGELGSGRGSLLPKEGGSKVEPEGGKAHNLEDAPSESLEAPMTLDDGAGIDLNDKDKDLSDDSGTIHEGSNDDIGKVEELKMI